MWFSLPWPDTPATSLTGVPATRDRHTCTHFGHLRADLSRRDRAGGTPANLLTCALAAPLLDEGLPQDQRKRQGARAYPTPTPSNLKTRSSLRIQSLVRDRPRSFFGATPMSSGNPQPSPPTPSRTHQINHDHHPPLIIPSNPSACLTTARSDVCVEMVAITSPSVPGSIPVAATRSAG
jgi:hypothetical protein